MATGIHYVTPDVPAAVNIVGGSTQSTTTAQTVITIPAGRTWKGTVGLSIAQSAAASTNASIQTAGANVVPAAGTIVVAAVDTEVTAAGFSSDAAVSSDVYVQAPAANAVTLVTNWATAPTSASAWANGILL
jgi:hypothetical protein